MKNTKFLLLSMILAASFIIYPLILSPAISNTSKSKQFELSETVKDVFDARANAIVKESAGKRFCPGMTLVKNSGNGLFPMKKPKWIMSGCGRKKRNKVYGSQV